MSVGIEVTAVRELGALDELRRNGHPHWDGRSRPPFGASSMGGNLGQILLPEGDLECVAVRDRALGLLADRVRATVSATPRAARDTGTCIQPLGTGRTQA